MTVTDNPQSSSPTSVALGYFDGMHLGHLAVLRASSCAALRHGATPSLLTFNLNQRRPSGKGALDMELPEQKQAHAQDLGIKLYVSLDFLKISDMTGHEFVKSVLHDGLKAVCVTCGEDFRFGKNRLDNVATLCALCAAYGIETLVVPNILDCGKPISTTRIKQALQEGDLPTVRRLLGHPYGFLLPVYEEKHLARSLGFPTMNQRLPSTLLPPRKGVYRTLAYVDQNLYHGISNIGQRPTVQRPGCITLETHLLNYDGNLYGKSVKIELIQFLRDERKFSDIEELRTQIKKDRAAVQKQVGLLP